MDAAIACLQRYGLEKTGVGDIASAAGVTSIVEPGGSRNDHEVIAAANAAGTALVFTGMRHFRQG